MIPSAKLTDFTSEQLNYAIELFTEASEDNQSKLDLAEQWNVTLPLIIEEYTFKRDAALLFKVQLMNALQIVEAVEQSSNN